MLRCFVSLVLVAGLAACQTTPEAGGGADESDRVATAWRICKADGEGPLAQSVYDACTRVIEEAKDPYWVALAYNNRSLVLLYWGREADAIDDLNISIRLEPERSPPYNNRGKAYATRGDFELAFADFDEALRLNPDSALASNNYAWFLAETGNYAVASEHAERAIALAPDDLDVIDTQAHVAMGLGRFAVAEEAFAKAMKLGGADWIGDYQNALARKGYDPGRSDGVMDEATQAALSACIRDNCRLFLD